MVQVAELEEPARVHTPLNVPVLLLVKDTVPEGVIGEPTSVSVTIPVQLVALFTTVELGVQAREMETARRFTVTALEELELTP